MPKSTTTDYQMLSAELEGVLAALQQPDVHVDEAVKLYEQGLVLVAKLQKHLRTAQNKLERLNTGQSLDKA